MDKITFDQLNSNVSFASWFLWIIHRPYCGLFSRNWLQIVHGDVFTLLSPLFPFHLSTC